MATLSSLPKGAYIDGIGQVLSRMAPTTYLDAAALAAVGIASGAYMVIDQIWGRPDPYDYIWYERPQQADGATQAAATTRNVAERMEELGKQAVIFWGSQSGTAEGFANRLVRELGQRFHLNAMAADLSDFDPESIALIPSSKVVIFILSTYGEGDPSDNATQFWEWSNKLKGASSLEHLKYAAFGLGNSNYQYYNRVVDVVHQSLSKAGASTLLPVGRADDAQGATEEDFLAWKDELYAFCRQELHLKEQPAKYEPTLEAFHDESLDIIDLFHGEPHAHKIANGETSIGSVKVTRSYELFKSTTRNCLHMEVDLTSRPEWTYKTGDHIAIFPINPDQEVDRLVRVLGLSERKNVPLSFRSLDSAVAIPVPSPTTITALFRYYMEICAAVSRETVSSLIQFAPSEKAKNFLAELYKSKEAYSAFLAHEHITLGKLLEMAEGAEVWSSIPLTYLVETLPRTRPRYYSISSSSVLSPRVAAVTALVSNSDLSGGQTIPGLTTNYLLGLSGSMNSNSRAHPQGLSYELEGPSKALKGAQIFAQLRRSTFKLPALASTPLIMAAAGTGIAPFRAFIGERLRLKTMGRRIGEMVLFFGCRHPDEDYIYREELEQMQRESEGKLKIVTAFSRVDGQKKLYVQDKMRELGSEVLQLLDGGDATLYICGRASMAREIGKTLSGLMAASKERSQAQAQDWASGMKRGRKWQEDVWG